MVDNPARADRLLGTHIARSPTTPADVWSPQADPGETEIGDPEPTGALDQEVGRFDIAMNDSLFVGMMERQGSLAAQFGGEAG